MPDGLRQAGRPEDGGKPQEKKRTWLVCGCIGCAVAFLTFVVAGLLSYSLLPAFFRELITNR